MYVMEHDRREFWKVGFYRPCGTWVDAPPMEKQQPDGTYTQKVAAGWVHWLNGGDVV